MSQHPSMSSNHQVHSRNPSNVNIVRHSANAPPVTVSYGDVGQHMNNKAATHHYVHGHSTRQGKSGEQVFYIPSGQPIIIVDERRRKDSPLPTIIRNGEVIYGDPSTASQHIHLASHGQPGVTHQHMTVHSPPASHVAAPVASRKVANEDRHPVVVQEQADEGRSSGRRSKRDTWGHSNRRAPPWGHHDHRCWSQQHGLKDWWTGVVTLNPEKRRRYHEKHEAAMREREIEREQREQEFKSNVQAWRNGRRDVHLW